MKNKLIITAAAVAGAAVLSYLFTTRNKNITNPFSTKDNDSDHQNHSNSHHLTDIFANAKKHVSDIKSEPA